MAAVYTVQANKRVRVILDTDAACEADDPFAVAQALLTPRFDVRGVIAEHFFPAGGSDSVARSRQVIDRILALTCRGDVPAVTGAAEPLADERTPRLSDGAALIIREAMADSPLPLFVLCQGAVTNVASAILTRPEIAPRFTCVWIGGAAYPDGGWEFNLTNDVNAANVLFASGVALWQVPMDCYTQMQVGYAELQRRVRPCGRLGRYLFEQMQEYGQTADWIAGESWALGDSPAVGLALNPSCGRYEERLAPRVDREGRYLPGAPARRIRVYHRVDARYILEDLYAKLEIFAEDETPSAKED